MFDSSKSKRRSSRSRKSVDTFILSDVNTRKSNHNYQVDISDYCGDYIALENSPSVDTRGKLSNLPSVMSTLAHTMQCITLCEERSIESHFQKVI